MKLSHLLAAAMILASVSASAEWTPRGPVKMMVPYTAGGAVDTQARLVAEDLESRFGWKVIPENVLGKGGGVMAARLKNEPADGTSFGIITSDALGYNMLIEKNAGFTEKDFTYLTTTAASEFGIVARASSGWKTLADVAAAAKDGRKIAFGAMTQQIADATYLLGDGLGVEFNVVSFKGGKAVLDAIQGGDIDVGWVAGLQAKGVKTGDLVNLASGESERLKMSPDAPTLKELGVDLDMGVYFMFIAPKGLPPETRKAMTEAIRTIVLDPKSKANAFITKAMGGSVALSSDELEAHVEKNIVEAKKLIKAVNQ